MIIELIYNLSVLVAISVLSGFVDIRFSRKSLNGKLLQGILFGVTAIIGMMNPFVLSEGIIFDGRSIVISLCTLFFGPLSGLISAGFAIIYRNYLGGGGALMGSLVIASSFLIGIVFNYRQNKKLPGTHTNTELIVFGFIVHVTMIFLMLTLPSKSILNAFSRIGSTVLIVYPIITLIIGKILSDQEKNLKYISEISEREKTLRTTLNSIGDAVITTDTNCIVRNLNPVAAELTGWPEHEAVGKPLEEVFNIINEGTRRVVDNPALRALKEKKIVGLENHTLLISKNGKEIPIADSAAPIQGNLDDIEGVVLTFRDQSMERSAVKRLEESEQRFRYLYENAPVAYQSLNENGVIVDVNKKWLNSLGYCIEEVRGKNLTDFMSQNSCVKFNSVYTGFMVTGEMNSEIFEMLHKNSCTLVASYEGTISTNEQDNFKLAHFIFSDITQRLKQENELKQITELQKAILDNAEYCIISTDVTGLIKTFNPAAEKMLGYSAAEIIDKVTPVIFHEKQEIIERAKTLSDELGEKIEPGFEVFTALTDRKLHNVSEWNFIKKNGKSVPVLLAISAFYNSSGEITGYLGIANDITDRKQAESTIKIRTDELKESEEKYRILFEQSFDAYLILDNNVFVDCNDAALKMLKLSSKSELRNLHPSRLSPPEQADGMSSYEKAEEMMSIALKKGGNRFEWIHRDAEGNDFDVEVTLTSIPYQGRYITHTAWRNITLRKKAENEIRLNSQRLKALVKIFEYQPENTSELLDFALNEALKLTRSKYGYVYYYNEKEEQFILNSWSKDVMQECSVVDPQTCYELSKTGFWGEVVRQRKEIILNDFKSFNPLKKGIPEGHVQLQKFMTIPVFDDNKIVAVVGVANKETDYDENDVHQLKLLMGSIWNFVLRRESIDQIKKLSTAIEQSPITVMITDVKGKIEYVNKKFLTLTGYSLEEVIGRTPGFLNSGTHDKSFFTDLWGTIQRGDEWTGEILNKKKNGEYYWESTTISPIKTNNGSVTHFIAVKEDITDRKNMISELMEAKESAEKANKLKSEFLAQMSHEIRSPINTIVNFSALIESELNISHSDDLKTCFTGIDSASKRVIRTIDLILNTSELQLGTYEQSRRKIDLSIILSDLVREYSRLAKNKNLSLTFASSLQNINLTTDDYAIKQIFANLIDNAIKYTREGQIEIRMFSDSDKNLIVEVEDTGIGISSDYIPSLFEPFTQAEQGYSRRFDGNGLGMSLVKKYCELIGVEISVKSELGVGSMFTVRFPKEILDNSEEL